MNKKSSNLRTNGLNVKLKHRKAQKSVLSGRLSDLWESTGELFAYMRFWTSTAASLTCLFQNNGDFSAKDYAHFF